MHALTLFVRPDFVLNYLQSSETNIGFPEWRALADATHALHSHPAPRLDLNFRARKKDPRARACPSGGHGPMHPM